MKQATWMLVGALGVGGGVSCQPTPEPSAPAPVATGSTSPVSAVARADASSPSEQVQAPSATEPAPGRAHVVTPSSPGVGIRPTPQLPWNGPDGQAPIPASSATR